MILGMRSRHLEKQKTPTKSGSFVNNQKQHHEAQTT
jgi:hypothetical protein